ncbi:GNAT family N-acetyltransferase [Sphingomonas sinipercae]|uniref:GNAT family N-acetyltransferase n=1 Tax=Sphingomonas sinipercae TaxID=2714944 RepID=A0A6G7ZM18_9SPHN|nr:GNAT family N-acetyltransferase [Sphingomonas sinipercae]QIL02024.1 GNAT family N-acetyltransferase [Sphingomonas sinipercae]
MSCNLVAVDAKRLDDVMTVMASAFDPNFGEAWTRSQCAGILPMAGVRLILAEHDRTGDPLGFSLYRTVVGDAELLLLGVAGAAQRQGIGRRLLDHFIEDAKQNGANRVHLEVRDGNPAIRLYEQSGFSAVGRRHKYYRGLDGMQYDALTFSLAD